MRQIAITGISVWLAVQLVLLNPSFGLDSATASRPVISSPADLRKAAEPYTRPILAPTHPPVGDHQRVFILDYLDSRDAEMRDAAADIIANSGAGFHLAAIAKYLDKKYPLNVRMAVLVWAFEPVSDIDHLGPSIDLTAVRRQATEVLNEAISGPVCPPYLYQVVKRQGWTIGNSKLIEAKNESIAMQRGFTLLSATHDMEALRFLSGFPLESRIKARLTWYATQPDPRVRGLVLATDDTRDMRPIYELALKDWDERNHRVAVTWMERYGRIQMTTSTSRPIGE